MPAGSGNVMLSVTVNNQKDKSVIELEARILVAHAAGAA